MPLVSCGWKKKKKKGSVRDEFRTGVRGSGTVQQCCEDLGGVQVGGVRHGFGVVAVVPVLDDRVKEVGEHLRGTADTLGTGLPFKRRKSNDGWSRLAGEIISALFARNKEKNSYCFLFEAAFFIKHKIRSVPWELRKITRWRYLDVYDATKYILLRRVLP